jgi:hypothetical protein
VGLAVAHGRAQAGLGSACRTADGPVAAFTCRDQLTLHVESALAQIAEFARMTAAVIAVALARRSSGSGRVTQKCWSATGAPVKAGGLG